MSQIDQLWFEIAALKAALSNMIRPGTVKSYKGADNTAVLDIGVDGDTHDIPGGANMAHSGGAHWSGVKPGMQVTVFAPEGDLANAFWMPGGYQTSVPQPSTRDDEDVFSRSGGAALGVREGGYARIAAASIDKLKINIGGQWFQLKMDALEPTSPLET